jgi:hypothetical protein
MSNEYYKACGSATYRVLYSLLGDIDRSLLCFVDHSSYTATSICHQEDQIIFFRLFFSYMMSVLNRHAGHLAQHTDLARQCGPCGPGLTSPFQVLLYLFLYFMSEREFC